MELTPGLRRLVFAVLVVALAGLGFFLFTVRGHDGTQSAAASSSPAPASAADAAASVPPTVLPAATPLSTAGDAQIYQWLPFTASDLSAAADTATAFAKAYATWNSAESAQAYGATFHGLASQSEITQLEASFNPTGAGTGSQSSTGSGKINSITQLSGNPTSVTFLVTISQQVTPATATAAGAPYDITVLQSGTSWLVNDLELPNTGNQGNG